MRVDSLSANPFTTTSLDKDIDYENIFSRQLRVKANPKDVLLVFFDSSNLQNIVNAINMENLSGLHAYAILGFSGSVCKQTVAHLIYFEIEDMQITDDLQLTVSHMVM